MNQLPNIDPKKLVWPEPVDRTALQVVKDGVWLIVALLAVLAVWSTMMTLDAEARAEDAERRAKHANARTANLMNGRPLVDLIEKVAYIPNGKVLAVSIE